MADSIFERDGNDYVATALARGPWDPKACHGGAPAALLAAAVDAAPSLVAMQGVRLTYDLLRPVPIGQPLAMDVTVAREGKRVQFVDATLTTIDRLELVRCRALRVRTTELALPEDRPGEQAPPHPGPDGLERFAGLSTWERDGFWRAVDVRFVEGMLGQAGRGIAWFRVVAPLIDVTDGDHSDGDGPRLTSLARAAAAADFGNGIGAPLPMGPYRYVNPDLTVELHRLPQGEWVAMSSRSIPHANGIGLTTSTLFDREGQIGGAFQSLFLDAG